MDTHGNTEIKEAKSLLWLRENYSHIWSNEDLTIGQKAGFLAACCDSRRCYLSTYSLKERVELIMGALNGISG